MTPPEGATSSEIPLAASTSPTPVDPAADRRTQFAFLLTSIVCYLAFGLIVPMIHFRPHPMPRLEIIAIVVGPTLLFMLLQMWLPWCLVRLRQTFSAEVKEFAVFGLLWAMLLFGFSPHKGDTALFALSMNALRDIAQTLTLGLGGAMIARIVREAKILLPLGIVAGLIDIVGAMTPVGFTAHMVKSHPDVVSRVSVHVPTVAGLQVGTIGPGDLLFIAFFFAVVHQHKLNTRWTFRLVYALLTLSMLAVELGWLPQVGALAPMGLAVIVGNWKYFTFSREEKFAMLYAGMISVAAAVGFFLYTNSRVFNHDDDTPRPPSHGVAQ